MTQLNSDPIIPRSRRRQPPRGPLLLLLLLLLVAAALVGYFLLSRPRLDFTNRLAAPVRLAFGEAEPRTIGPGESVRVVVPRRKTLVAMWELVRPLSADGRPMGEEIRGSVVERDPSRTIRGWATARGTDADYFAPLITNATDALLRVTVNAGLEGGLDCGCAVRPGARRVFIGYYRLYQNSTAQVKTGDGREATFRDLGPSVVSPDGAVGLRFESKDLARPGPTR